MTEMPFDVINNFMHTAFDEALDRDQATDRAMDLDQELQSKFLFFNIAEEIAGAEIHAHGNGTLRAGSGQEVCTATGTENPNWLYNHAVNALALWWALKERQDKEAEIKKLSARPAHGWYLLSTGGMEPKPAFVTEDRRIYLHTSGGMLERTDVFDSLEDKSTWKFTRLSKVLDNAGIENRGQF